MPVKTATSLKKAAAPLKKTAVTAKPKSVKKTAPAAKAASSRKAVRGDSLECGVCGLVVTVDEISGYAEETVLLCCDQPMKPRRKVASKAKK